MWYWFCTKYFIELARRKILGGYYKNGKGQKIASQWSEMQHKAQNGRIDEGLCMLYTRETLRKKDLNNSMENNFICVFCIRSFW